MPKVVHCKKTTEPFKYIGRPSPFGNPFPLKNESDRELVIGAFKAYFVSRIASDHEYKMLVETLRGHDLGCWCAPRACHGDVILEYLEGK